jgi:2-isopropylmalate synthase
MDRIKDSLKHKRIVFWEEVARDGAQAKTIMNAKQRIDIARMHGEMFNTNGPDHLVFAVGFVSIGKEEQETIREVAEHVDNCYLAVNCRSTEDEILQSFNVIKNAKYGRIAFVLPASERLCRLMMHKSLDETLMKGVDIAKFAMDNANGIPVDLQMAAAFDNDPIFIADMASAIYEQGVSSVGMGDTRGAIYPKEVGRFLDTVIERADEDIDFSVHFHDDMGFALINNLAAIKRGIMMPAVSWMGLAERNGLLRTELLTVHLAFEPEKLADKLNIDGERLFLSPPKLKMVSKIAQKVSNYTGVSLKSTDPMVGTGVNSISTGTPFVDRYSYQPFDPEEVLGIPPTIYVTQLASRRVIKEVGSRFGFNLSESQIDTILPIVKSMPYQTGRAVFPEDELKKLFYEISK